MKQLKRALWFIAALIFLIEAWLWDHLYPLVARLVDWLPWASLKRWVADRIEHLPAGVCVFVFLIPAAMILPFKILGVWLLAEGHVLWGATTFLTAKMVGLGVTAFLFESCKNKLLTLRWFYALYRWVLKARDWAVAQTEPARRSIHKVKLQVLGKGRGFELLKRFRRRINTRMHKV